MKKHNILLISLFGVLALASCGGTTSSQVTSNTSAQTSVSTSQGTTADAEIEPFADEVLKTNIDNLRKGFKMTGNVLQERYNSSVDNQGNYIPVGEPIEENRYVTEVAFNSETENAFYKYSYRTVEGVTIPAEGPYTYFEDENGYAYTEVINYSNTIIRDYDSSLATTQAGLTFADNGFYNFATILLEDDFTKDESTVAFTRYDLNIDKAAIISNNLLYSLNSGAYALPEEAYVRVDNGIFTSLNIVLSPIQSVDIYTGQITMITNTVTFTFSNIGEETITHLQPNEATADSAKLEAALSKFADTSYKMTTVENYESTNIYTGEVEQLINYTEDYYFTGEEIYIHERGRNETSTVLDKATDYYLAPASEADPYLYPYGYDSATGSWVINSEGYYDEDGSVRFAKGYCGTYLYEDLLPTIAGVSGTFFTYNADENAFYAKDGMISYLSNCFIINERPFNNDGFKNADTLKISLDDAGNISQIDIIYNYTDSFNGIIYDGNIVVIYSELGNVTLEGLTA